MNTKFCFSTNVMSSLDCQCCHCLNFHGCHVYVIDGRFKSKKGFYSHSFGETCSLGSGHRRVNMFAFRNTVLLASLSTINKTNR